MTGTLREDMCAFMTISRSVILRMREVWEEVVEKMNTHMLVLIMFSQKSFRLWGNVEKSSRAGLEIDGDVIQQMHFECWITKATHTHTHTHTEYVIIVAFPRQQLNISWINILASTGLFFMFCIVTPIKSMFNHFLWWLRSCTKYDAS